MPPVARFTTGTDDCKWLIGHPPCRAFFCHAHCFDMSVHTPELQCISRRARREFSVALMSDTKWRKVFEAWAKLPVAETQMLVKFLDVPEARVMRLPDHGALWCPTPYIDSREYGPVELRAIEWLEIPAVASWPRPNKLPARQVVQELDAFRTAIALLGQFPLIETERGIRVEGFRP